MTVPVRVSGLSAPIPVSSMAARDRWIGQNFFLEGEDRKAENSDRFRVGFEMDRIPGFSQHLSANYNWSTSQQPGDTTMNMGIAWQVPLGDNQLALRGRLHQYQDEVDSADVKRVGGTRQTLEIDMSRRLYRGSHGGLDARVITTDVTRHWYENGDLSAEARRSYSLVRVDGYLERHLSAIGADGDLGLTIEGCVALMDGTDQQSCGEQLGAFQRYNLNASLRRQWLNMDWGLHGEYQFTPDELPSWRYMEVGPGMIHGFGGQVMRGREGGWLRLDSETRDRLLWSPLQVYTNVRFSLLRGWTEAAGDPNLTSRASVAEVLWQVSGENLSGGIRAGTLLESTAPGIVATNVPDVSVNLSWTL
jgi:hemolysin activation/secretion protein